MTVIPEKQETNEVRPTELREFKSHSMSGATKAEPGGFHILKR